MLGDAWGCPRMSGNTWKRSGMPGRDARKGYPEGMPGRDARKGAVLTIDYEGEVTPGGSTLSALLASR